MPDWKVSLQFDAPKAGWLESWYLTESTIDECVGKARNLCTVRNRLLGKYATIEHFRISRVDLPRRANLYAITLAPDSIAGQLVCDTPWNGPLGRVTDVTGAYQRTYQLRATPDVWINRLDATGKFDLDGVAALKNAWDALMQSLRANGFQFRARSAEGAAGTSTEVTFGTSVGSTHVTVVGAAYPVGTKLTFSDFATTAGSDALKVGYKTVTRIEGGLSVLNLPVPEEGPLPMDWGTAKARLKITALFAVNTGTLRRPGKRDTGRPFGLQRGRQPAKR